MTTQSILLPKPIDLNMGRAGYQVKSQNLVSVGNWALYKLIVKLRPSALVLKVPFYPGKLTKNIGVMRYCFGRYLETTITRIVPC